MAKLHRELEPSKSMPKIVNGNYTTKVSCGVYVQSSDLRTRDLGMVTCQRKGCKVDKVEPRWTAEQQRSHRLAWAFALESGQYKQAQSALKENRVVVEYGQPVDKVAYCCLGVGCEVAAQVDDVGYWEGTTFIVPASKSVFGEEEANADELPPTIRDYYGLSTIEGMFVATPEIVKNDDYNGSMSNSDKLGILMERNEKIATFTYLNDTPEYAFPKIAKLLKQEPKGLVKAIPDTYETDDKGKAIN